MYLSVWHVGRVRDARLIRRMSGRCNVVRTRTRDSGADHFLFFCERARAHTYVDPRHDKNAYQCARFDCCCSASEFIYGRGILCCCTALLLFQFLLLSLLLLLFLFSAHFYIVVIIIFFRFSFYMRRMRRLKK